MQRFWNSSCARLWAAIADRAQNNPVGIRCSLTTSVRNTPGETSRVSVTATTLPVCCIAWPSFVSVLSFTGGSLSASFSVLAAGRPALLWADMAWTTSESREKTALAMTLTAGRSGSAFSDPNQN